MLTDSIKSFLLPSRLLKKIEYKKAEMYWPMYNYMNMQILFNEIWTILDPRDNILCIQIVFLDITKKTDIDKKVKKHMYTLSQGWQW